MKRITAIVLVFILSIALAFPAGIRTFAATDVDLNLGSVVGVRGDVVTVSIDVSSQSNLKASNFKVLYDSEAVELVEATKGTIVKGQTIINTNKLGEIIFSSVSTTPLTDAGSILDLDFKIKDDAPYGERPLTVDIIEFSDGVEELNVNLTQGGITVEAPSLGRPTNLEIIEVMEVEDSHFAEITWNGVDGNTGYNIYLNGEKHNDEVITENVGYVTGLLPETEYRVNITTLHYGTESDMSEALIVPIIPQTYDVTFMDINDEYISTDVVLKNEGATPPAEPTREGYTFTGWDTDFSNVTSDLTVTAEYEQNSYQVEFVNWNSAVIDTQDVLHGENAVAPENPSKPGFAFIGWDKPLEGIIEDTIINAVFEETECLHTNVEIINAIVPTCTTGGYTGDTYCNDCEQIIEYGVPLGTIAHSYISTIVPPTPEAQGYTLHECSVCGENFKDTYTNYIEENEPQIFISSDKGLPGAQLKVKIELKNNPGITSMRFNVSFDETALTLTNVEDTNLLSGKLHKEEGGNSPYTLAWSNPTLTENIQTDGEIVILTFDILEEAEIGQYPITVTYDYDNSDIMDKDFNKVRFALSNGYINVSDAIIGDINADGSVNMVDQAFLGRHLANWDGYSSSDISMMAADVNADGFVNMVDQMVLGRHLANWDGYDSLPY